MAQQHMMIDNQTRKCSLMLLVLEFSLKTMTLHFAELNMAADRAAKDINRIFHVVASIAKAVLMDEKAFAEPSSTETVIPNDLR